MKTGFPSIDKTHLQGTPEGKLHPKIFSVSMYVAFSNINEHHFDEIAIETNGKAYTKKMFRDDIMKTVAMLLDMGLKKGDKIALAMPNCYEGIVATFAANAIGIPVAMLDSVERTEDIPVFLEELKLHQPKLVLLYGKPITWVKSIRAQNPNLPKFLVVGQPDITESLNFDWAIWHTTASVERVTYEIEVNSFTKEDAPMVYLKTSGSTSKPKILPFSNRAIFASLVYASNSTGTDVRDKSSVRAICQAPYQHGYGWMPLFVNIIGGNTVILAGGAINDVANWYKLKPTYIYGTPVNLRQFMETTPKDADISMLDAFFCAGATISEEEYQTGINYFRAHNCQAEIRNNYGISEGMCIGTSSDHIPHRPGTIGKFYIGPEWLLVDEDGNEVKYGESGEAIVSAESLCQGYYNDPEATAKAFIKRDGKTFFKTGDYLTLYEDGYVRFDGRKLRFFFAPGVTDKVNCETIERALNSLHYVEQSAVIVTPDDAGAKAFVILESGYLPVEDTKKFIMNSLRTLLKPFQIPREIVFVENLPLLKSGKVDYKLLEIENYEKSA